MCFGREDEVIVEMQEELKTSQGGILKERAVDHLILNYNRAKFIIRESKVVNAMLRFSRQWSREELKVLKLALLSIDKIPKSVVSYYTKWSDFITKDASCRCGIQISFSDVTVQHLTVYFAHRGGKGNLGKKRKKFIADHRAKISKGNLGKEKSADHRVKMSKAARLL